MKRSVIYICLINMFISGLSIGFTLSGKSCIGFILALLSVIIGTTSLLFSMFKKKKGD